MSPWPETTISSAFGGRFSCISFSWSSIFCKHSRNTAAGAVVRLSSYCPSTQTQHFKKCQKVTPKRPSYKCHTKKIRTQQWLQVTKARHNEIDVGKQLLDFTHDLQGTETHNSTPPLPKKKIHVLTSFHQFFVCLFFECACSFRYNRPTCSSVSATTDTAGSLALFLRDVAVSTNADRWLQRASLRKMDS